MKKPMYGIHTVRSLFLSVCAGVRGARRAHRRRTATAHRALPRPTHSRLAPGEPGLDAAGEPFSHFDGDERWLRGTFAGDSAGGAARAGLRGTAGGGGWRRRGGGGGGGGGGGCEASAAAEGAGSRSAWGRSLVGDDRSRLRASCRMGLTARAEVAGLTPRAVPPPRGVRAEMWRSLRRASWKSMISTRSGPRDAPRTAATAAAASGGGGMASGGTGRCMMTPPPRLCWRERVARCELAERCERCEPAARCELAWLRWLAGPNGGRPRGGTRWPAGAAPAAAAAAWGWGVVKMARKFAKPRRAGACAEPSGGGGGGGEEDDDGSAVMSEPGVEPRRAREGGEGRWGGEGASSSSRTEYSPPVASCCLDRDLCCCRAVSSPSSG